MPSGYENSEDYGGPTPSVRNDWPLILMVLALVAVGYYAMKQDDKRVCRDLRDDEIQTVTRDGKRMISLDQLTADDCVVIRPQPQSKP